MPKKSLGKFLELQENLFSQLAISTKISASAELVAGDGSGDGHVEGFGGAVWVGGE